MIIFLQNLEAERRNERRKKLQRTVNHSVNRCGGSRERRENQWESMSNHQHEQVRAGRRVEEERDSREREREERRETEKA